MTAKKIAEVSLALGETTHLAMTIALWKSTAKEDKAKCRVNRIGPHLQKHLRAW